MALKYLCPHCNGYISLDEKVYFSVRTPDFRVGLISLHTELGKYSIDKHSEFEFDEGEQLDFYCPICHAELASKVHSNLANIVMVDENNNEFEILFSKTAGKKSTYKIIGETMEIFGDDSAEYIDFINLSSYF
jgi:hypothetical protein